MTGQVKPVVSIRAADSSTLIVTAPEESGFPEEARRLGGILSDGTWIFRKADEGWVRKLLLLYFGFAGCGASDAVCVRVCAVLPPGALKQSIELDGLTLVDAEASSERYSVAHNTITLFGEMKSRSVELSPQHRIRIADLKVRKVPSDVARRILFTSAKLACVTTTIWPANSDPRYQELLDECERLLRRLQEIDELLT